MAQIVTHEQHHDGVLYTTTALVESLGL